MIEAYLHRLDELLSNGDLVDLSAAVLHMHEHTRDLDIQLDEDGGGH